MSAKAWALYLPFNTVNLAALSATLHKELYLQWFLIYSLLLSSLSSNMNLSLIFTVANSSYTSGTRCKCISSCSFRLVIRSVHRLFSHSDLPYFQAHTYHPIFKTLKMASLRRTRTMPTDGAIAKFLYTILKQLDLKSVRNLFQILVRALLTRNAGQLERGCFVARDHERTCCSDAFLSFQAANGRHPTQASSPKAQTDSSPWQEKE